jgi:hypothetical protein
MANKFKIYVHPKWFLRSSQGRQKPQRHTLWGGWIFQICYKTGLGLIKLGKSIGQFASNDLAQAKKNLSRTFDSVTLKRLKLPTNLAIFFVLCLVGWLSLSGLKLLAQALEIKRQILGESQTAKQEIKAAGQALTEQNFSLAADKFSSAARTLAESQKKFLEASQTLNLAIGLNPKTKEAKKVLSASSKLAASGRAASQLLGLASGLKFSTTGLTGKVPMKELLTDWQTKQAEFSENFAAAKTILDDVDTNKLPGELAPQVSELKNLLEVMTGTLSSLEDLTRVSSGLLNGQKKVLILFQNSNELRATGGFWGTFGEMQLRDGTIEALHVSSIYDLDGQLKKEILPPHPLLSVNNRWFLRDSNWFADFPTSAKKAISFYEQSGGETPDFILALTPQTVVDMLKITGPISLPKYGLEISADNFSELAEYATTLSLDLPENKPKQFLAELFVILLQKAGEFDQTAWLGWSQNLFRQLSAKDIIFYSRDRETQKALENLGWAGNVKNADRDFLMVVTSNLGGTKTDHFISQSTELKTRLEPDGSIINELTLTRTNRLPVLENTSNESFIRVYVPLGSELLSSSGFDYKNLDTKELQASRQQDLDIALWESNLVKNVTTGTLTGRETGKTFFANWLTVKGGETRTVKLTYRLPFQLKNLDRFSLTLQKQPGIFAQPFKYTLSFSGWQSVWANFAPDNLETSRLEHNFELGSDKFFGLVLERLKR